MLPGQVLPCTYFAQVLSAAACFLEPRVLRRKCFSHLSLEQNMDEAYRNFVKYCHRVGGLLGLLPVTCALLQPRPMVACASNVVVSALRPAPKCD